MKRSVLHIFCLLVLALPLSAQNEYRPFKLDVGFLLGEVNEHSVGLVAPYIEPKLNINNHFTVGMRFEYVFYSKENFIDYDPNNPYWSDFDADGWTFSTVLSGDYYFNDHYFRPFVGVGAGLYYMYNAKENSYLNFNEHTLSFGYVPRVGFNLGEFRCACEYNFILSDKTNLSYFSLKVGYEIGGGKKWF